jgi:hypothetical protein
MNISLTLDAFCWGASPLADRATIRLLLVPTQGFNQQIRHKFASPNSFRLISQSDCTLCTYTWLQRWITTVVCENGAWVLYTLTVSYTLL